MTRPKTIARMLALVAILVYAIVAGIRWNRFRAYRADLAAAELAVQSGKLKSAQAFMLAADQKTVSPLLLLPPLSEDFADAAALRNTTHQKYQQRLDSIRTLVTQMVSLFESGKTQEAYDLTVVAAKQSDLASLKSLQAFAERMKSQDFSKTDTILPGLDVEAPAELMVADMQARLKNVALRVQAANKLRQGQIALAVRSAIRGSGSDPARFRPVIKGHVMVWDFTKQGVDLSYELLRDELKASSSDTRVTAFCILERKQILQGYYSVSHQPGYQETMTIGVVYWPSRQSPGTVAILGDPPRQRRPVTYSPEYGSAVRVKDYIEQLPVEPLPPSALSR